MYIGVHQSGYSQTNTTHNQIQACFNVLKKLPVKEKQPLQCQRDSCTFLIAKNEYVTDLETFTLLGKKVCVRDITILFQLGCAFFKINSVSENEIMMTYQNNPYSFKRKNKEWILIE